MKTHSTRTVSLFLLAAATIATGCKTTPITHDQWNARAKTAWKSMTEEGKAYCWGTNISASLGIGTQPVYC